jgi:hypothetical protein
MKSEDKWTVLRERLSAANQRQAEAIISQHISGVARYLEKLAEVVREWEPEVAEKLESASQLLYLEAVGLSWREERRRWAEEIGYL